MIRPSYVLGGRGMEIVRDGAHLDRYVTRLAATLDKPSELVVSDKSPLLIDRYLSDATEIDVDCLCDGKDTFVAGIMEHIEEAGIHSGDSACALPPHSLDDRTLAELERQTRALALALHVGRLMNVQYAIKDNEIYVLEVNPRASRTVPFVAKVIGLPVAKIASRIMAGESLKSFNLTPSHFKHKAVKEAVFPFARFPGVDTVLGPEMKSTGEVMGIDTLVRDRLRQEPDRRRHQSAARGHRVRLGQGRRQAAHPAGGAASRLARLQDHRHLGHPALSRGTGRGDHQDQQVLEGRPHIVDAHKKWPGSARFQYHRGGRRPGRQPFAAPRRPSCIKCRTTPLFQVPLPRRKA